MLRLEEIAYVLHIEPFKETSGLVHFLTQGQGHVLTVARGMKRRRGGQATLQPFIAWHIRAQGRGDLLSLSDYQAHRYWPQPVNYSVSVTCAYIHELLIRLLRGNEANTLVFESYEQVLDKLLNQNTHPCETHIALALRPFEKRLLAALGYGLPLTHEPESGTLVSQDKYYIFDPLKGPRPVPASTIGAIRGDSFWALETEVLDDKQHLYDAKRLTRVALRAQLGDKPLNSQRLWLRKSSVKEKERSNCHE
ncbi:MAG: hypothetical protein RLZ35_458 [Pseudomonadota bacterium]|jgi:DNA repair protein RecO (recombination protein O)